MKELGEEYWIGKSTLGALAVYVHEFGESEGGPEG